MRKRKKHIYSDGGPFDRSYMSLYNRDNYIAAKDDPYKVKLGKYGDENPLEGMDLDKPQQYQNTNGNMGALGPTIAASILGGATTIASNAFKPFSTSIYDTSGMGDLNSIYDQYRGTNNYRGRDTSSETANIFSSWGNVKGMLTSGINYLSNDMAEKQLAKQLDHDNTAKQQAFQIAARNNMNNLTNTRLAKYVAFGGPLNTNGADFTNGLIEVNAGGTHEQNPYGGVPMGIADDGQPNLVEEGEVIKNNYVYSNRIPIPKEFKIKYKLKDSVKSIANAMKDSPIVKEAEERPFDKGSKETLELYAQELMNTQDKIRQQQQALQQMQRMAAYGGLLNKHLFALGSQQDPTYNGKSYSLQEENNNELPTWMENAARGIQLAELFNNLQPADYSNAKTIEDASNALNFNLGVNPLGDYMAYNPLDLRTEYARLDANNNATRRALMNSSNGNRATRNAALLANQYNYNNMLGDMAIKVAQQNQANKAAVAEFNRATNKENATLKQQTNAQRLSALQARLQGLAQAASMRETIDANRSAGISNSMSNINQALYDIARENKMLNMINASSDYKMSHNGNINYDNGELNPFEMYQIYSDAVSEPKSKKSKKRNK